MMCPNCHIMMYEVESIVGGKYYQCWKCGEVR